MKYGYFEIPKTILRSNAVMLTLAEVKSHLRVTYDDDDALISGLINAATDYVEAQIEKPVVPTTMSLSFDTQTTTPIDRVYIRVENLISAESVLFDDVETDFSLNKLQQVPFVSVTPTSAKSITVQFTAGYEAVPADLRHAALLMISHWYKNTEAVASGTAYQPYELPFAVTTLLSRYKGAGIA